MYTHSQAIKLGVRGYVRNLSNGDVEIMAVGEIEAVNALIEWAKSGSPSAVVKNLKLDLINDLEEFEGFEIRY